MGAYINDKSPWLYHPSLPLAILATVIYGFTCAVHFYQVIRYRTWFAIPLVVGAAWETIGYIFRIACVSDLEDISSYSSSISLVVLAPALVAAFDYMLLGRLLHQFLPDKRALHLPAQLFTIIFVTCDVVSFLVQCGGTGLMASSQKNPHLGTIGGWVVMGGLGVQLAAFGLFTAATVRFHVKMRALKKSGAPRPMGDNRAWLPLLLSLYASCILIILRSAYRLAEFSQGSTGSLASSEVFFYALEALPMIFPFYLFNIFHPGRLLAPGERGEGVRSKHRPQREPVERKRQSEDV